MKKKFLILISFFIFSLLTANKAHALTYTDPSIYPPRSIALRFCNGQATNWGVRARYYDRNDNLVLSKTFDTNNSAAGCSGGGYVWYINDARPDSGDYVIWTQACVDPRLEVVTTASQYLGDGAGGHYYLYESKADVRCHAMGYNGTAAKIYAGCYNLSYGSTNYSSWGPYSGTVTYSGQCPYLDTNRSYCTAGGNTAYSASCGASYCGGSGNCTYYNKTCSGTSCSHPGTAYSTKCGGNNISGTNMCSKWSYTCSPPGPSVSLSRSCGGSTNNNPVISVNYGAVQHSDGNYDLRWRESGGSWHNVCTTRKPASGTDYTLGPSANLDDSTTYEVQVRGDTVSGYNGPTNFGSDTITTLNCNPTYPITGTVFVDDGSGGGVAEDGIRNGSEPVFTGGATLKITNTSTGSTGTTSSNSSGTYTFSRKNGPYSISASATGYRVTSTNPRIFSVSGAGVNNINFGIVSILTASSWYQSIGGDVRQDDGISVALPTGQYFSASQATPVLDAGVIFTAQPSASFGGGTPNQNNWLAKNNSFSPLPPGIKTSYAFISANVTKLGLPTTSISAFPSSLTPGSFVYKITGDLNMTGSSFTFPANGSYVFLVDGNLTIDRNIIVPQGSIAVFVVSGDITVSPNVTDLEGIYSADQQFKFETGGSGVDAPLIVEGSIIGNADLSTNIPFVNLRDLGDVVNATTPSIKVVFRPDFVLHVPDLVKKPSYSVSEIAPVGGN